MLQDRNIVRLYNGILTGTYTRPILSGLNSKWPWVNSSDNKIFNDTKHSAACLRQLNFLFHDLPRPTIRARKSATSVASHDFQTCQGRVIKNPKSGPKIQGVRKNVFIIKILLNILVNLTTVLWRYLTEQEVKVIWQKGLTGAHSPVRGHPRGSKVVPLNSWGRVSC